MPSIPIFRVGCCGEDDWVVDVAQIPVPTVFEKLFFEKVARLIQYTWDCDPEYSVEAFDWEWASFHKNILLPNRMHIRLVMQLSDTITDRVVYSVHFLLNRTAAIGAHERQVFDKLLWGLVTSTIFVRC